MRRILVGTILFGWIAFLAGVVVRGLGAGENGLLHELQIMLIDSPAISMSFELARGILTGVVVLALTVALWAFMFAVATEENERRERIMSLGAAYICVLSVCAVLMIVSAIAGSASVIGMLFAIQVATLVSMIAAGGVEIIWERGLVTSQVAPVNNGRLIGGFSTGGKRLASFGPAANDPEPR